MKSLFSLVLTTLIIAINLQAQIYLDSTFSIQINPSLPPLVATFTVTTDYKFGSHVIYHIIFRNISDSSLFQEVVDTSDIFDESELNFLDINFDKYLDFNLVTSVGSQGSHGYHYWTYNKNIRRFEKNQDFEEVCGEIKLDPSKQLIHTTNYWGSTCCNETYRIQNGKPLEIECETLEQVLDRNGHPIWHTTIEKLINGKMKVDKQYDNPDQ